MTYFKCLDTNSEAFIDLEEALGAAAAWQAIKVISEAFKHRELQNIDVIRISRWAGIKRDRAQRLLPYIQNIFQAHKKMWRRSSQNEEEIFSESIDNLSEISQESDGNLAEISPESTENVSEISQESTQNLLDFTASSPYGSTHACAQYTNTESETNTESKSKSKNPPLPPKGESEGFQKFYSAFPKKENRPDAWKAWRQIGGDQLLPEILAGIEKWQTAGKFAERKYIPNPGPWLRGRRWEDEMVLPTASEGSVVGSEAWKKRFSF